MTPTPGHFAPAPTPAPAPDLKTDNNLNPMGLYMWHRNAVIGLPVELLKEVTGQFAPAPASAPAPQLKTNITLKPVGLYKRHISSVLCRRALSH